MNRSADSRPSAATSLSRERIVQACVQLLDQGGESGLTLRALSRHLATGAGAIYWHIAGKDELLSCACDAVVVQALASIEARPDPREGIRAVARVIFEALDAHPWAGAVLGRSPGERPVIRLLERLGQHVETMGLHSQAQWPAVSALLHYMLGVSAQNAAHTRQAVALGLERERALGEVAAAWAALDPDAFPAVRRLAAAFARHEDAADFMAGVDWMLDGIEATAARGGI